MAALVVGIAAGLVAFRFAEVPFGQCSTLAAVSISSFGETERTDAVLVDGEIVFTKTFDQPQAVQNLTIADFFQVNKDSHNAYFSFQPDGLGGYMLYGGRQNLYKLDLCSKKVAQLSKNDFIWSNRDGGEYILDISSDESLITGRHFGPAKNGIVPQPELYIQDVSSGTQKTYNLPSDDYYAFDAKFSPDGLKVAVAAAKVNPEDEGGVLWIFDVKNGKFESSEDKTPEGCSTYWMLNGWNADGSVNKELASSCQ